MKTIYNGKVYLGGKYAEAIVIDGRKIAFIGSTEEAEKFAPNAEMIDAKGGFVSPGFIDSHAHGPLSMSSVIDKIDMSGSLENPSLEGYQKMIRDYMKNNPEAEFIEGMGWVNPAFDKEGPTKEMLDEITGDIPAIFYSGDVHSIWANSKAIEMAGITPETTCAPGGIIEKNEDGSVRGTFREEAKSLIEVVKPPLTVDYCKKALKAYQEFMVGYGITSAFDAMIDIESPIHKAYLEMAENDELIIKAEVAFSVSPDDDEKKMKQLSDYCGKGSNGKLYTGNYAKFFVDGVIEGGTALLKEPYCNREEGFCGDEIWQTEELNEVCRKIDEMGYDLHFHAIGDDACSIMLDAMEYVIDKNGEKTRRPVAAHMQLVDKADYPRFIKTGMSISADPYWFFKAPGYFANIESPALGEDRANHMYPMKAFFDMGLTVASASDFSVTPEPYPLSGMQIGIERVMPGEDAQDKQNILWPEERVTLKQMFDSFTINAAYTMGIDDVTGSLEVGKLADIVILEKNIFEIPSGELGNVPVLMTISEGKIVYEA